MDENSLWQSRLSKIETRWTLLGQAHGEPGDQARHAQGVLFERYRPAIHRYLIASLRNGEAAEEVLSHFAMRIVEGRFSAADPARGRFRDYVKTTLIRMIIDYRRKACRGRRELQLEHPELAEDTSKPADEAQFDQAWRSDILQHAWRALADHQRRTGQLYYTVLRHRSRHPKQSSASIAQQLTARLRPDHPYTEAGIRKTLQRAREKLVAFILEEVGQSLQTVSPQAIEDELRQLQLLSFCQAVICRQNEAS